MDLDTRAAADMVVDTRPVDGAHEVESTRDWLQARIDGRVALAVGVAWLVAYQLAASLEPVTHQPEPWYGVVLGVAFMALLAGTAAGLIAQRRWGLVVSLAAAGFFTALSVACPVSGHHPFGAWWFGQMACALGMVALSWFALARPVAEPVSAGDEASRG